MTGFQVLGTGHLGGSPVEKILAEADDVAARAELVERQADALNAVRERSEFHVRLGQHREMRVAGQAILRILQERGL